MDGLRVCGVAGLRCCFFEQTSFACKETQPQRDDYESFVGGNKQIPTNLKV